MLENSIASARILFQEIMRGHDAYRGKKAFQRLSRNAAVVRQLVVVWDERRSFILHLLRRFIRPSCSGFRSDETCATQFENC